MRWSATATLASMTRSRISSAKPAVANSQLAVTLPSTGSEPLPPGSPKFLHAIAEGLSAQAAARVFQMSETTVRSWITRAGQHWRSLYARFLHALKLTAIARSTR